MLHIQIIAVGKLKERYWTDACQEYLKRLGAYANVAIKEIPDIDPAKVGGEQAAVLREGEAILNALDANAYPILLDIKGKQLSSEGIADEVESLSNRSVNDLAFIIGGSCGTSEAVRDVAKARWSFGPITLPHNLARVVLLEQIYRAFKIIRHEPYHK